MGHKKATKIKVTAKHVLYRWASSEHLLKNEILSNNEEKGSYSNRKKNLINLRLLMLIDLLTKRVRWIRVNTFVNLFISTKV